MAGEAAADLGGAGHENRDVVQLFLLPLASATDFFENGKSLDEGW
jgi:hypothetical protein